MEVKFYKHDSYIDLRRKFTGAWANLRLVIHHQSEKFWRGSDDELEDNNRFFPLNAANTMLFTLHGAMTTIEVCNLFVANYRVENLFETYLEPFIYGHFGGEIVYTNETETLDECDKRFAAEFGNAGF